jgi:proteasome accessory factor A
VVDLWEKILTDLEIDPRRTADRLDWTAKLALFEGYINRDNLDWNDSKLALLDLQYHDVDPEKGLYDRLAAAGRMQRLFSDEEVGSAVELPPEKTRAYFRGRCVAKYRDSLVAANWDSLVFDVGGDALKRVPMMEPLRGSKELVGGLIDQADTAGELLQLLGGE